MNDTLRNLLLLMLTAASLMLVLACGSPSSSVAPSTNLTKQAALNYVVATNILEIGEQRIAFLLSTPDGILKTSSATVTPVYLEGDGSTDSAIEAQFNLWPYEFGVHTLLMRRLTTLVDGDWISRWIIQVA